MTKFPRPLMSDSKITPDVANSAAKFDRIRRAHQFEDLAIALEPIPLSDFVSV